MTRNDWLAMAVIATCSRALASCGGSSNDVAANQGSSPGGDAGSTAPGGGRTDDGGGGTGAVGGGGDAGGGGNPDGASTSGDDSGSTSDEDAASPDTGGTTNGTCGQGDPTMPAEPAIPPACTTLQATRSVPAGGVPDETNVDTAALQAALDACGPGKAVRLTASGGKDSFVTGPLTLPAGVTLWVDAGTTLYGTRSTATYGSARALISVHGASSGIVGDGIIDGQGGEPNLGSTTSFWDSNAGSGGNSPALIEVRGASNFTLYRITLQNSPKFHVKLGAAGFVVWGVTIHTPSKATNSAGTTLTYTNAHNTDGIDPGEAASNGYIVCSRITTGDDQIAIKGSSPTGVTNLVIAHNRFGAGHGMSIGSEFTGGVSGIDVHDLSIDGMNMHTSGGSSNGLRIKSDSSRGGLVKDVTYTDICVRNLSNPIFLTPKYSSAAGTFIPQFSNIVIRDFRGVSGGSNVPIVTLDGYDAAHASTVTLDNIVIDGLAASQVTSSYTQVTLGPGAVNFTPFGTGVAVTNNIAGTSTPNSCANKWVTF